MEYYYITEDFTKSKIDYSYAEFHGLPFVKSYFIYRSNFLTPSTFGVNYIEVASIMRFEGEMINYISVKKFLVQCLNEAFETKKKEFDLLIKRFEVTKKIYSFYDLNFRPHVMYKDDLRLNNFLAFSYALSEVYAKTKNIKYLNTLIKANDILCSSYKLLSLKEKKIFAPLIKREVDFIHSLLTDFNIKIQ